MIAVSMIVYLIFSSGVRVRFKSFGLRNFCRCGLRLGMYSIASSFLSLTLTLVLSLMLLPLFLFSSLSVFLLLSFSFLLLPSALPLTLPWPLSTSFILFATAETGGDSPAASMPLGG